jgi:hypothetical protein
MILVSERGSTVRAAPQPPKRPHPSVHLKAIKSEVFRPPNHPRLYSILVGLGMQFSISLLATAFLLVLFFKSETYRGQVLLTSVFLYIFSGTILGYSSAKIYMNLDVNACLTY